MMLKQVAIDIVNKEERMKQSDILSGRLRERAAI